MPDDATRSQPGSRAARPTRAQKIILDACAAKGLRVIDMFWEPWQAASEMEGIGGGWVVEFENGSTSHALGLSAQETADYIREYVEATDE